MPEGEGDEKGFSFSCCMDPRLLLEGDKDGVLSGVLLELWRKKKQS